MLNIFLALLFIIIILSMIISFLYFGFKNWKERIIAIIFIIITLISAEAFSEIIIKMAFLNE